MEIFESIDLLIVNADYWFQKLQHQEPSQFVSRREGKKTENVNKNRYKNIIPYDHTRIVLRTDSSMEGADYINANLIEVLIKYSA